MQKYVTPAPGRFVELGNIIRNDTYKLDVRVVQYKQNLYNLTIRSWIPEHGWQRHEYFVDAEELTRIRDALDNAY